MGLHYHSEYAIGPRGGRICRTYNGFPALVAISVDLLMGLVFGLFTLGLRVAIYFARLAWGALVLVLRFVIDLLRLPFRAARWTSDRVEAARPRPRRSAKPAFAGLDEV